MTRYAIIQNGAVDNVTDAVPGLAVPPNWIASATAQMGDRYDAQTKLFSRPDAPPAPVPAAVTQRQARRALRLAGKLQLVEQAIEGMPGDVGEDARIDWEFASSVERASPLVATMGALLEMDGAGLDELFRQAAAL